MGRIIIALATLAIATSAAAQDYIAPSRLAPNDPNFSCPKYLAAAEKVVQDGYLPAIVMGFSKKSRECIVDFINHFAAFPKLVNIHIRKSLDARLPAVQDFITTNSDMTTEWIVSSSASEIDPPPGPDCTTDKPSQDGSGGFLWKPISESNGGLVVIFPEAESYSSVQIYFGDSVLAELSFAGRANGNREHWRSNKPGPSFPDGSVVFAEGVCRTINDTSKRID